MATQSPPSAHPLPAALDSAWQALQHNRRRWLADPDSSDALHELRVAWRRLRALLDLLRRTAALASQAEAVKAAGRPLAQLSSPLRDIDVLAAELAAWRRDEPALAPLDVPLSARRTQQLSPLSAFLEQGWPGLEQAIRILQDALAAASADCLLAGGPGLLQRCEQRVQRAFAACTDSAGITDWHRLRIRCKQWRYTLELLAMLATGPSSPKALQKVLRSLRKVQESLGAAQDAATFIDLLQDLAQPSLPAECLLAVGRRQVMLHQQREAALQQTRHALEALLAD